MSQSKKNEWEFARWANERIAFWADREALFGNFQVALSASWGTTSDEAGKVIRGQIIKSLVCSRKDFTLYPENKDSKQGSHIIRFCFIKMTLAALLKCVWSWREWKHEPFGKFGV